MYLWFHPDNLQVTFHFPLFRSKLDSLNSVLCSIGEFQYVDVGEFSPPDAHEKYKFIQKMNNGPCVPCCLLTYSAGGNVGNSILCGVSGVEKEDFTKSLIIIETIKEKIPTFHTRAMRKVLFIFTQCETIHAALLVQ